MKTAREVAEEYQRTSVAGCYGGDVDLLTAAIEARDAELLATVRDETKVVDELRQEVTAERNRLREALESLARVVCHTCRRDADAKAALKASP